MNVDKNVRVSRFTDNDMNGLLQMVTKHSGYQEIHPALTAFVDGGGDVAGKAESSRWEYMRRCMSFKGERVLDIGANTGFFSLSAALEGEASSVIAWEGSPYHAEFLDRAVALLGLDGKVQVENKYYDFSSENPRSDITLCLNVLHHLGDDFGDSGLTMRDAKAEMTRVLRDMAAMSRLMWLQVGFNWKGDRNQPLFDAGLKEELITFVSTATAGVWSVERVGVYNPEIRGYEDVNDRLLARFDEIGEFMNRPLFLLRSRLDD